MSHLGGPGGRNVGRAGFISGTSLNCRRHYRLPATVRHLCTRGCERAGVRTDGRPGVRREVCGVRVCQQGDQARVVAASRCNLIR